MHKAVVISVKDILDMGVDFVYADAVILNGVGEIGNEYESRRVVERLVSQRDVADAYAYAMMDGAFIVDVANKRVGWSYGDEVEEWESQSGIHLIDQMLA